VTEEEFHYLSTEIDFVIHAAAYVNLIYPYQALHGSNVLGTQHLLIFACTSKLKPIHYIRYAIELQNVRSK
jgi:thioester reductase-like protein